MCPFPPLPCLRKPDLPAVSHRGTLPPCAPSPLSGRLTPSPRGEDEEEGEVEVVGMTGDNGGVKEKKCVWGGGGWGSAGGKVAAAVAGWVVALKLPLMCPLHSPACDLRAPDSQKVLKHAGVLTLQPHTHTHTYTHTLTPAQKHVLCSHTHTHRRRCPTFAACHF